jgi:hypothetical protein
VQVKVAKERGGIGFLFWNANNNYSKPYDAMPSMKAAKLFRGDEIPAQAKAATSGPAAQLRLTSATAH